LDISVVIINYNGDHFLHENLKSLVDQTIPFKQIIVVDNHSADKSLEILNEFNNVKTIELKYNSGYACGANIGISQCNADLILVANSDTYFERDFNAQVTKKCSEDPEIALLSPLILRFGGKQIDSAGQTYSLGLYPREIGYNQPLQKIEIKEGPVFSVCGAATIIKCSFLDRLKINNEVYDEDYFSFWEDFDLGWRASLLGLKTYFYPQAVAYHYRSGTLKKSFISRWSLSLARSPEIKFHLIKNRYLTLIKNFRWSQFWWTIPFVVIKDIIWVGALTLSSPKIIIKIMLSSKYLRRAFKKRKLIKQNE
jgi:GT2 family glycosyltransferase